MKIIGAGLPRTATLSQKVALETLGFGPCYHMVNVLMDLSLADSWRAMFETGAGDWDSILGGYDSTVDWPGSFFWKELVDYYPDAKVLLSTREGDAWEKSMTDTIWGVLYGDILIKHISAARRKVDPAWDGYMDLMEQMWQKSGLIPEDPSTADVGYMARAMEDYNEQVKSSVPADRLLVWTATDGWEPLCEFLEVPVPDSPFPRVNDSAMFADRIVDGSLAVLSEWRQGEVAAQES